MTIEISPVFLLDMRNGHPAVAELWDGITEEQLADWEAEWTPVLLDALQRLHRAGVPRKFWPQSRHWDWRRKTQALQGMLARPGFCVMCEGVTQGMMLVDAVTRRVRHEENRGRNLVYIDFLENAPWNRRELTDQPRFRGVGSILLRAAIELSKASEFKGRIGLHSLPQSNDFYANKIGMTDFGIDKEYENLRYFEMTAAQAESFIERGNQS